MKFTSLLILATMLVSISTFSQATKGKISYDVYASTDDPAASEYVDKLEGSMLELQFVDGKIRSDLYIGEMMTTTSISHKDMDSTLVLLDGMMGRIAMKVTENDMTEEQKEAYENIEVDISDETKEINGYKCKKATITSGDAEETVVWYTEEILPAYRGGQYLFEDIPGVPMEMYSSWGKMDLKIVAYKFKEKVKKPKEVFSLEIPDGFVLRTQEEMKQMGGK